MIKEAAGVEPLAAFFIGGNEFEIWAAMFYCGKERPPEARFKHVAGEIGACAFKRRKKSKFFVE